MPKSYFNYISNQVKVAEMRVLGDIGLHDIEVTLPNKFILKFCQTYMNKSSSLTEKCAYAYINDAYNTPIPLFAPPKLLAATSIYMAQIYLRTNKINEPLPDNHWY